MIKHIIPAAISKLAMLLLDVYLLKMAYTNIK